MNRGADYRHTLKLISHTLGLCTFYCIYIYTSICCCSVARSCHSLQLHKPQHARIPCPSLSTGSLKLKSTESVMPLHHLILCCPLLFLPSIVPSMSVFSNELALCIRWPKYWSFHIRPSNEYSRLISFGMDWFDRLAVQETLARVFSSTTIQKHQFLGAQPSIWSNSL